MGSENVYMKDCFQGELRILNHWGFSWKSGGHFYGDFRPYFRKKKDSIF